MDVLIAGAGIGGLTAAIALRRNGHRVKIYEQSQFASESGAAIFLPPNANGPLRTYGFIAEELGANRYEGTLYFSQDGERQLDETISADMYSNRWDMIRRSSLHSGLKALAVDPNGPGPAAELHTSSRVAFVDADNAILHLTDGTEVRGDVLLGADGSHSIARECIGAKDGQGQPIEPHSSGRNCFRFLIDRAKLTADPATAKVYERTGSLISWNGKQAHLVSYPCESNKVINFVAIHPNHMSDAANKDYTSAGSKPNLQKIYEDFEPTVQGIMRIVDSDAVKLYPLNDMEVLPTYIKGRMALLGDAAHPFLPYLAQGGAQAIEDGLAMGVVLSDAKSADVPDRLKLYEVARKTRAEYIRHSTRLAGSGMGADGPSLETLRDTLFTHDEVAHSQKLLEDYKTKGSSVLVA